MNMWGYIIISFAACIGNIHLCKREFVWNYKICRYNGHDHEDDNSDDDDEGCVAWKPKMHQKLHEFRHAEWRLLEFVYGLLLGNCGYQTNRKKDLWPKRNRTTLAILAQLRNKIVNSLRENNPLFCSFSLQVIFFSEQQFYGNYWTLDSHKNTVIFHTFAYSSRWRRKPWQ